MMTPTHVMKGVVLCLPLFSYFPEYKMAIFLSIIIGFSIPDLDLFFGDHRRTLHYPYSGIIPTIISLAFVILYPTVVTVSAFIFFLGVWIHSVADIFGGAVEDEPWRATETKVVYNHIRAKWIDARRTIPYDGSPRDLGSFALLTAVFVLLYPLSITTNEVVFIGVFSFIAVFYTTFRKTLFSPVYMEENHPRLKQLSDQIRGD